jgi:UDP-N-acetylmuramate--alanine ligase
MIAEADEFDRSFLHLHPQIAVITSIDADHLDIYGNHAAMLETFSDFSANIIEGGFLILKYGLELPLKLKDRCHVYSYSATGKGDFTADSVRLVEGLYHFDFRHPSGCIPDMVLGLPGLYNVENAVAALAASWLCGVEEDDLRQGLKTFQGVCRRFDIRINRKELVYIDDYAHHPAELRACITAARRLFPQKKLTGIFQPHLYTRTRDFADEFAESLDLLDEVILLPVYPARELPIEGINSEMLLSKMSLLHKKLVQKEDIPANLNAKNLEVLLTLGAGDIDTLVEKIENHFNSPIKTV